MRLIDADVLDFTVPENPHPLTAVLVQAVKDDIDKIPTIDAVPVVRCVNCIHFGAEACAFDAWTPYCLKHKRSTFPDDFCSYGERKEDNPNVNHNS